MSQENKDKAAAAEARTQQTRGSMQQVRVASRQRYTPEEKDGDSMIYFVTESFANVDGRGLQEQQYMARSWRRPLQCPVTEIDNFDVIGVLLVKKQ